jgi:predicted KAP-like P-loop ATPase
VSKEKQTVNSGQLEELKKLACNKIRNWAKGGKLAKHKQLAYILLKWKEWGQEEEVNDFVNDMIKNDEGLIDFITRFLNKTSVDNNSEKIQWRIEKSIEAFVNPKELEPRIRKIFNSPDFAQLEGQKKLAIETFLNSIDGEI